MSFGKLAVCSLVLVIAASVAGLAQNKYVGVKTCAMCHKAEKQGNQVAVWQKTKHAEAFTVLTSPRADSIAKAKGLKKPASESPECLQCHVAGFGVDAAMFDKNFDQKDGVQCEVCHGPGSNFDKMAVMKDKAKAVAAGLAEYKDEAAIEAKCKSCHNEKSPVYKPFSFKERWEKIKHPKPKS